MSRPKTMIKQSKKKKKEQILEDADDYLAAGVEHEEAAGKWRAGDGVKSLRFFNRAIEVYIQGLTKYPQNLDLAYNRARVELEIATHPLLVPHLEVPIHQVLEQSLQSHRYALSLDTSYPDTLFNTAQVLVTIAEELAKDDSRLEDTLKLLEEALELQNQCLSIQELRYEESLQQQQALSDPTESAPADDTQTTGRSSSPSPSQSAAEEQWFSVVEPTTADTLIDTILAQLSTLTTLTSILGNITTLPPSPTLQWISSYPEPLLTKVTHLLTTSPTRDSEATLTKLALSTTLLDASFHHSLISSSEYKSRLTTLFSNPSSTHPTQQQPPFPILLLHATSLQSFASTLSDSPYPSPTDQYLALTNSLTLLTTASKLPSLTSHDLALTHLHRGNASLAMHNLSLPPTSHPPAVNNATQLLKNAEVYYRNAAKLFPPGGEFAEEKAVAGLRCTVAQVLQGKQPVPPGGADQGREREWVRGQVEEMVGEGLVVEGFGGGLFG